MWERVPSFFRNKYFIITAAFLIWIGFLDRNNLIYTFRNKRSLEKLSEEKNYYIKEIETTKRNLYDLRYNNRTFEKFAREHYLLKREKEEIFLIDENETPKKNESADQSLPAKQTITPASDTTAKNSKKK